MWTTRPLKGLPTTIEVLALPISLATATFTDHRLPLLQAQDLGCRRGARLLFKGLNLAVSPGQVLWVRGTNGQGKTSLLRLLAGLSEPASGLIQRSAPLTYVGHQHALKDDLTAQEALTFLLHLSGERFDEKVIDQALERLGVKHKRHALVRTLSQGQKRRVALARLACAEPGSIWLLDEPFDAIDDAGLEVIRTLLCEHIELGGAVVMTSHQQVDLPNLSQLDLSVWSGER